MSEPRRKSDTFTDTLSGDGLDLIFRKARTHNVWLDEDVPDALIRRVYDLMRMGPTSANCCPARFLFLRSREAKERLRPHLSAGNRDKTMAAPVTAIIGYDLKFYEKLPKLFPHEPGAPGWFNKDEEVARVNAFRNGTLQGAYFIIAARALGLDCGPMSGFDNEGVDREFFPDGRVKSNFLCSIGYGDAGKLFPRSPRLDFEEACEIL